MLNSGDGLYYIELCVRTVCWAILIGNDLYVLCISSWNYWWKKYKFLRDQEKDQQEEINNQKGIVNE